MVGRRQFLADALAVAPLTVLPSLQAAPKYQIGQRLQATDHPGVYVITGVITERSKDGGVRYSYRFKPENPEEDYDFVVLESDLPSYYNRAD